MKLKTKEGKVDAIRNVINNDSYMNALSQEEVNELFEAIKKPIEERQNFIRDAIERIFKTIGR